MGHLPRLIAVARWLRRYAAHAGVRAEIYFLTSSEADSLLSSEGLASFKLPSTTMVGDTGIDRLTYVAMAKQWVWHSLSLLRPDLLVVDTFSAGAFGELSAALDLCRERAFIYPAAKDGLPARPEFQAMLPLYDAIIVSDEDADARVKVPDAARAKVRHVGPILLRERSELLTRDAARADLALQDQQIAVYVSTGGGGARAAEEQLSSFITELRLLPELAFVIGAGPLYRGRQVYGSDVRWLSSPGIPERMNAFDLAVCAPGYNTYHELMFAGVPAVFVPQEKVSDDHALRAARAARSGAAMVVDRPEDGGALRRAVQRFMNPSVRAGAAEAARTLVPRNHARDAAAELLRLLLPPSVVDAAEDAIGDELLRAARDLNVPLDLMIDVMHALAPHAESEGAASDRGGSEAMVSAKEASAHAAELLWFAAARDIPPPSAARLSAAYARKLVQSSPRERASAARRMLSDLLPFNDWPAVATLLKLLAPERHVSADALGEELAAFLCELQKRGADLYRGVAFLSAAHGAGVEPTSNMELLRAAKTELGRSSACGDEETPLGEWDLEVTQCPPAAEDQLG